MQFKRMFSTDAYKGTSGYLRTQKIMKFYERCFILPFPCLCLLPDGSLPAVGRIF